eukprot:gb/GEZN01001611.1/.p1 GENE.gb/GEZN01001611.1/~~gb/GEZN01001611.1/.p1  ORF type:complete len:959 (-),score=123.84 gb/GEZN01001611.1/:50-2509(-)
MAIANHILGDPSPKSEGHAERLAYAQTFASISLLFYSTLVSLYCGFARNFFWGLLFINTNAVPPGVPLVVIGQNTALSLIASLIGAALTLLLGYRSAVDELKQHLGRSLAGIEALQRMLLADCVDLVASSEHWNEDDGQSKEHKVPKIHTISSTRKSVLSVRLRAIESALMDQEWRHAQFHHASVEASCEYWRSAEVEFAKEVCKILPDLLSRLNTIFRQVSVSLCTSQPIWNMEEWIKLHRSIRTVSVSVTAALVLVHKAMKGEGKQSDLAALHAVVERLRANMVIVTATFDKLCYEILLAVDPNPEDIMYKLQFDLLVGEMEPTINLVEHLALTANSFLKRQSTESTCGQFFSPAFFTLFGEFKPVRYYKARSGGSLTKEFLMAMKPVTAMAVGLFFDYMKYFHEGLTGTEEVKFTFAVAMVVGFVYTDGDGVGPVVSYQVLGTLFAVFAAFLYFQCIPAYPGSVVIWTGIVFAALSLFSPLQQISASSTFNFVFFGSILVASEHHQDLNSPEARVSMVSACSADLWQTLVGCALVAGFGAIVFPIKWNKDFYNSLGDAMHSIGVECIDLADRWMAEHPEDDVPQGANKRVKEQVLLYELPSEHVKDQMLLLHLKGHSASIVSAAFPDRLPSHIEHGLTLMLVGLDCLFRELKLLRNPKLMQKSGLRNALGEFLRAIETVTSCVEQQCAEASASCYGADRLRGGVPSALWTGLLKRFNDFRDLAVLQLEHEGVKELSSADFSTKGLAVRNHDKTSGQEAKRRQRSPGTMVVLRTLKAMQAIVRGFALAETAIDGSSVRVRPAKKTRSLSTSLSSSKW